MSRKIEVLTRILSNARIVHLEAHIDHEQSDDIKKFRMSVSCVEDELLKDKDSDIYTRIVKMGVMVDVYQKDEEKAFAQFKILVEARAFDSLGDKAEKKFQDELLGDCVVTAYEYAKNELYSVMHSMAIQPLVLPTANRKNLMRSVKALAKDSS